MKFSQYVNDKLCYSLCVFTQLQEHKSNSQKQNHGSCNIIQAFIEKLVNAVDT